MMDQNVIVGFLAAFCGLAAYTERKDTPRCIGMILTGFFVIWVGVKLA